MRFNWLRRLASGTLRGTQITCGLLLVLVAFSGTALGYDPAPEISPGSAVSGLALLSGGMLLLADRFRRK